MPKALHALNGLSFGSLHHAATHNLALALHHSTADSFARGSLFPSHDAITTVLYELKLKPRAPEMLNLRLATWLLTSLH